jgi:hypothetical protein
MLRPEMAAETHGTIWSKPQAPLNVKGGRSADATNGRRSWLFGRGSRLAHPFRDAITALVHGQEGVLRELLRLEPVAGHQTERLEQSSFSRSKKTSNSLTLSSDLIVGDKGRLHGV